MRRALGLPFSWFLWVATATPAAADLVVWDEIPLFGGADSVVVDAQGQHAYLTNGAGLLVVDVQAREATALLALADPRALAEDVDEAGSLVSLAGPVGLSTFDLGTGEGTFQPSGYSRGAALAGGFLFGGTSPGVLAIPLDGGTPEPIDLDTGFPCRTVRTPDRSRILFGDFNFGSIFVIDPLTRSVIAQVPLGVSACSFAALDAETALVANAEGAQLGLVNLTEPFDVPEVASVDLLETVTEIVADPGSSRAALLVELGYFDDDDFEQEIAVLDLAPLREIDRLVLDWRAGGRATDLALVPGSGTILVTTERSLLFVPEPTPVLLALVAGATLLGLARARRPTAPARLLGALGAGLVATAPPAGAFQVVDRVPLFGGAESIVVDSTGARAYLLNGTLLVELDVVARTPIRSLPVPFPSGFATRADDLDETDSLLAISRFDRYAVVDVGDGAEVFSTGASSSHGAVLSNGFLFGANFNGRNVTVAALDGSSLDLIDPTGGASVAGPCEIVRSPDRSRIFVADEFNGSVHVLDAETRLVTASLPIGVEPCALAAIDTARLLVASTQTDQVAVIDADDPGAVPEPASTGPLGFVLETAVDRDASRAFLLVQLGYFSFEDPELELVVLDLDPLAEVERIPFEFPRDGRATDLALVPGTELVLVSTDRSVLFVPEARRLTAPLALAAASGLALGGRRRRRTGRVEPLARTC